jgi:hypothetical protein
MGLMSGSVRRLFRAALASLCALAGVALGLAPPASAESCPNAISRQGASAQLPDCRAYELVTPVNKGVAEDMFNEAPPAPGELFVHTGPRGDASVDGNKFLMHTTADFGTFAASQQAAYLFSRGAGGWTTLPVVSPSLGAQNVNVEVASPDFSEIALDDTLIPKLGGPAENPQVQLVGPPGGPYAAIHAGFPSYEAGAQIVGGSADLSHVVIETYEHNVAPGDTGQEAGYVLDEWVGGQWRLVNVDSSGALLSRCGARLGEGIDQPEDSKHNAVSVDGSKIFITAPDPGTNGGVADAAGPLSAGCWDAFDKAGVPPQLYMRVDGSRTVEVSAPDPGVSDPAGPQPVVYVGASDDGSRVFFLTKGELTPDDEGLHATELYEYNTVTATLMRVSRGVSGHAEGSVDSVPVVSGDGSTVYFLASGQLAPGAPVGGGLYRYDTASGTTTFVTGYTGYPEYTPGELPWFAGIVPTQAGLDPQAPYFLTNNDRFLVFGTAANVTGYDSHGFEELYRYDAVDGSIVCVSCDPSGAPPTESAKFTRDFNYHETVASPPRPVSEDGSYVFFDTSTALVPHASRGVVHVYEWHEGAISLIGSPADPTDSFFMGSSADGSNVFFGTHAQLVSQDTDFAGDLYDARVDGGFEQPAPPACTGTGCQGVPSAPPLFATPASTTFNGVGNFPPPPAVPAGKPKAKPKPVKCRRGTVKRQGKCVKKAKAKKPAKGRK